MQIGQEGDNRKYRRLRSSDFYSVKHVADLKVHKWDSCRICGRRLEGERKDWGGLCFECFNEPL